MENLQNVLPLFILYELRTDDIVALLRYIHMNTCELIGGYKETRALLTSCVGYEINALMKDKVFQQLMIADGGELLVFHHDGVKKISQCNKYDNTANK